MEAATTEELHKITTMKLTITFFTTKLENFITETNATDEDLLMLLSHLTDCIQNFVLAAKVIKTQHMIESVVDKSILSCENIFECLACNVQTGKTYSSVINHITTKRHMSSVKQFEKQKKPQPSPKTLVGTMSNNLDNFVPVALPKALPHFPTNTEINQNHAICGFNSQSPFQNGPFAQPPNNLINLYQQPLLPLVQGPMLLQPIVGINNRPPANQIQMNVNNKFGINSNTLANGLMSNDYKNLFRMPLSTEVVGFQHNVVSPSNKYLKNINRPTEVRIQNQEAIQPSPDRNSVEVPAVKRRRNRRRRRSKTKKSNDPTDPTDNEMKMLNVKTISFLNGDFENEVMQYIKAGEELLSVDLYTAITTNLKECCREMNLNVEVKCFGSRIIGIGSAESDVDLNISVTDCNHPNDNFLQELVEVLSKKEGWKDATYIKSRVSLVRVHHVDMRLDCDITFNNELAMANTKLIKYFYSIQPECQKLVVFVKMMTEKTKLHPQINTYTINLLVFFYFQCKGYLPKVLDIIEPLTLKYWPSEFKTKTFDELNIKKAETFKELCVGFMNFYANCIDFESNVLSTYTGTIIPKSLFGTNEYRATNDCFNGLLQYMEENARATENVRTNFKMAMCVQDPFSHDHNVSRCVGKLNLKRFKECCHDTCDFLNHQSSDDDLN